MKIAFDENVPPVMAKVFVTLAKERGFGRVAQGFIIKSARDYAPQKTDPDYLKGNDVPWLTRFAKDDGKGIISGDVSMRRLPHERLALYQHNFVVIFFESQWGTWDFCRKAGLLLHWWPAVAQKLKTASPGTFWVIPCSLTGDLRNVSLGLAKMLKDNPEHPKKPRAKKLATPSSPQQRSVQQQTDFFAKLDARHEEPEKE